MPEKGEKSRKNKKRKHETNYSFDFLIKNDPPTREDFLKNISKHLAKLRQLQGWTQDKLNHRLGSADALVSKWECGIKTPTGFNLYCWADALSERLTTMPKGTMKCVFYLSNGDKIIREFQENAEDCIKNNPDMKETQ